MRRVILVHGIREHGEWFGLVTPALEARELKVHTIQFDHTGILTLLIPPLGREARAADVRKKLEQAFEAWPNDEISIIAFSFGTYLVTRAMLERSDLIKPKYLILSGAIASRALDWNRIGAVLKKGEVLNECGIDDPWPVVAESFAVGYGYVGTRGVGHPRVKDRFHKAGHSTIYKSQGRPICEDWAQIIADDKDPSHQFAGRSPKWFGWIKWGVRALMALAVMLLLLVVFQRQAEAYVGGKIWPWETVRAELHREVDLSRSSCIDGARETVQQITETYRFSHPVRRFNIREIVRTDAGRFPHVTTRDGAALPTDFSRCRADERCHQARTYTASVADERAAIQLAYAPTRGEPDLFTVRDRGRLQSFSYRFQLPEGVSIEPNPDARILDEDGQLTAQRITCASQGAGLYACSFEPLPDNDLSAENGLVVFFKVNGWSC